MNSFYVSLIFIGIMLVIVSLILIFLDKKNVFAFRKNVEETKRELVEIINDAEQMIEELNRFSDYIVTQMDLKSEELNRNLRAAEKKIKDLSAKATQIADTTAPEQGKAPEGSINSRITVQKAIAAGKPVKMEPEQQKIIEDVPAPSPVNPAVSAAAAYSRSSAKAEQNRKRENDKVIPFNSKYAEVLRLSREGMKEVDIAKNLSMGKGEVELIIGLRK